MTLSRNLMFALAATGGAAVAAILAFQRYTPRLEAMRYKTTWKTRQGDARGAVPSVVENPLS